MERRTYRYEFLTPFSLHKHPPEVTKVGWLLEGLKENTTAHGIPHIDSARGTVKKIFWIMVVLVTLAAFGFSAYRVVDLYFRYDVTVNVMIKPQRKAVFPAVTVCNMSPVKQSALSTSPALQSVLYGNSRKKRDVTHNRVKRSYPFQTCDSQTTEPINNYCFTLFDDNLYTRTEALLKCLSIGMELAKMPEPEMVAWQAAEQSLQSASTDTAWIGLKKNWSKYRWGIIDEATNTNWANGQPDTTELCVYMDRTDSYKWRTDPCSQLHLALCGVQLAASAVPTTQVTTEPTTLPTTQVTTESATVLTTQVTTELTTAPTTQVTTEPTNVPTTQVTTEPTTVTTSQVTTELTTESTTQVTTEPTTVPTTQVTTKPTTVQTTQVTTEPTTVLTTQVTTEPTTVLTTQVITEPTTVQTTQVTTEPTTVQTTQVTTKPTTVLTTQVTTEPTTVQTTQLTTEPTTVQTTQVTTEPTIATTSQVTTEPTTVPTTQVTTKPITVQTTQVTTEPTTVPTTQVTTEPTTVLTTQVITEPTTVQTTQVTTEPTTVQTTQVTTKPTTVLTTQVTTEPTTVQTTQLTTEPTTVPTTQVTTEPTTLSTTKLMTPSSEVTGASFMTSTPGPEPIPGSRFPDRIRPRESFVKEEEVTEILADLSEEEKRGLGFNQSEFILSCKFDRKDCNDDAFSFFYNTIHGNCYIFNSGWKSKDRVLGSRKTGQKSGLSLVLNIGQDEYVEAIGDSAGARVVIHDQDKMPFPEEEGILVSPGYATSVGIKKVQVSRLPDPYGDCIDPAVRRRHLNVYEETYPVKYSTMACYKTCYQRHVIQKCGCADSLVPKFGYAFNYTKVLTCDIRDIKQDDCRYEISEMYGENEIQCDCPRSCKEINFKTLSTRAQWPSDRFNEGLRNRFSDTAPTLLKNPNDTRKYERNILKVEVFYSDLSLKTVGEEHAYGAEKLLSDVGGLLGLLAGFSILTLFEFVEFFMDLLVLPCLGRKNKIQTDVKEDDINKMAITKEAFTEAPVPPLRKRRASYRPSYIKQTAFDRRDQYADLFDLNH